jgi:hopanoid biosynthesis associated radical SAM protein HpnH
VRFPLRMTVDTSIHAGRAKAAGDPHSPMVLMLEPTLACNLACIGCGKILEYEDNRTELTVEQCLDAARESGAPVVSICGGEPLIYRGIDEVVEGLIAMGKHLILCTNGLRLEAFARRRSPHPQLSFAVHLDGMEETHDHIVARAGVFEIAVRAIAVAKAEGHRVTTNTTIYRETDVEEIREMLELVTALGVDGVMLSPAFGYEAIDKSVVMTRDEIIAKFRAIQSFDSRYPVLTSPIYREFLRGERSLTCHAWGTVTRNPYGWKGPCYLITDRIHENCHDLLTETRFDDYGPGRDPRCEHCMMHSSFEPAAADAAASSLRDLFRMLRWTVT